MILEHDDISSWATTLLGFKPEYTPIKVWSPLQFYTLVGRKTTIILENFIPIPDLHYTVATLYQDRFYLKEFRDIDIRLFLFSELNPTWDIAVIDLQSKITDGSVWLLLNEAQIADTTAMLERLYKSRFVGAGKITYKTWISLACECLRYEDYRINNPSDLGFRTKCKQYENKIKELWDKNLKK